MTDNAHTWILFSAPQPLPLGYRVCADLRSTAQEPPRRPPKKLCHKVTLATRPAASSCELSRSRE